jgi:hypothetical protein
MGVEFSGCAWYLQRQKRRRRCADKKEGCNGCQWGYCGGCTYGGGWMVVMVGILSKYSPREVLKMAYFGHVHPYLSRRAMIWDGCAKVQFFMLFHFKKAIRIFATLQLKD